MSRPARSGNGSAWGEPVKRAESASAGQTSVPAAPKAGDGQAAQVSFPWTPQRASSPASRCTPAERSGPTPSRRPGPVRTSAREGHEVWITADEATAHLGLPSRKALYAAVARGQVPAHRLGRRRLRFNRSELDSLLGRLHESSGVR
jgi:excisionase family DNA binding protein